MRDVHYQPLYDRVASAVVAIGNDYLAGHVVEPHSHGRSQLLYGATGVMTVVTEHGAWVVPPEQAVWLPAGEVHSVHMTMGPVQTRSAFVRPDAIPGLPDRCQVLGMSALMRELLLQAVDVPLEYDPASRDGLLMALLQQEMTRLPVLPLSLPFPRDRRLARRCRRLLDQPTPHDGIDQWAKGLGMSRRAFTRLFREQTGMSFAAWRQQACLFAALPRLAAGEAVTTVALDLGYDSPAAFTSMFRRALGAPPSRYFSAGG
ncbi:AraC family transcriptional regulator [Solimonas sp. K1W22B-7]|uniref:AraC family transcriptional regulator n=1 Tax=Solimonas sp. K1W22B-7 TaxID=2303331 RepID=UPI000E3328D2|nr:helix-turn-helix transcriptional regulator [Solimonas sp. K1W22B-7]AXQ27826.1 AraC family transcriptional regulator [Solimonas sp. K1W22B-7]